MTHTWTPTAGGGDFTGFWSDIGHYLGPWPPAPPTVRPGDAGRVDFYVFVPPLSGDFEDFAFDNYADAYIYDNSPDPDASGVDYTTVAMPPGSHLWVFWYPSGFPSDLTGVPTPSVTPDSLVPPEFDPLLLSYGDATVTAAGTWPPYALGATAVTATGKWSSYALGTTAVAIAGVAFHTIIEGSAESDGQTAVQVSGAVDGATLNGAYAAGATLVSVANAGTMNGAAEADGATVVTVAGFSALLTGTAQADGSTLVRVMFFPDIGDNDPIGMTVGLVGDLAYIPVGVDA